MLFNTQSTLVVSTALFAASSVAQEGFKVIPRGSANGKLVGCYSSAPGYGSSKDYTYQSSGWCLNKCYGANSAAFALTGGSTCMCGDTLPPDSDKVDSGKCNKACTGWPSDMCMLHYLTLRT
jgi:cell wall integrity and stress response component